MVKAIRGKNGAFRPKSIISFPGLALKSLESALFQKRACRDCRKPDLALQDRAGYLTRLSFVLCKEQARGR